MDDGGPDDELVSFRSDSPLAVLFRRLEGAPKPTWWWTRAALGRGIGAMYLVAFLIAARQIVPLVGAHGILPARWYLADLRGTASGLEAFLDQPTLFQLDASDGTMVAVAWIGVVLSAAAVAGLSHPALFAVLWFLYLSIAHVGQVFWGYGWESLLLEAGFLAIFLYPLRGVRPVAARTPPPLAVIWLFRWLVFRVMFGAGLIKLRGDPCWVELSCLDYHYETQPLPNPLTPLFAAMPHWFHAVGVLFNHFVELIVPFGLFGPRKLRHAAGALTIVFQTILVFSGNLSFLNWLTIAIALSCFDDQLFERFLPARGADLERRATPSTVHRAVVIGLFAVIAVLSVPIAYNMLSSRQLMNASFDRLHLVNTYGAFGSVNSERYEVVLEGTPDELGPDAEWRAWELPCKPGDPGRAPCVVSPYHYRLDWQMWFAALTDYERQPWIVRLVWLLLNGEDSIRSLFANDPFPVDPPKYVRALLYRYELTGGTDPWWRRELVAEYLHPLGLDDPALRDWLRRERLLR